MFFEMPPLPFLTLFGYLVAINVLTFFLFGLDKHKARKCKRRISEKTLLLLALFGGSPAVLLGMGRFRHKTKKLSFQTGIVFVLTVQILLFVWFLEVST